MKKQEPSASSSPLDTPAAVDSLTKLRMIGDKMRMNLHDSFVWNPEKWHAEALTQLLNEWNAAVKEVVIAMHATPAPADTGMTYLESAQILASTGDTPQPLTIAESVDEIDSLLSAAELDNEPLTVSTESGLILTERGRQQVAEIIRRSTSSETEVCPSCRATDNNPYTDANGVQMRACGRCLIQWQIKLPAATGKPYGTF